MRKAIAEGGAALPFVQPFDVSCTIYDEHHRALPNSVTVGQPFLVVVDIKAAQTPHAVWLLECPLITPVCCVLVL